MKKTANTGSTAVELEKELGMSEEELFSFAEYHPEEAERTGYSEYSYWKSVFRSFRKNKAAVIMIVVFIAIFIFSYVALVIAVRIVYFGANPCSLGFAPFSYTSANTTCQSSSPFAGMRTKATVNPAHKVTQPSTGMSQKANK